MKDTSYEEKDSMPNMPYNKEETRQMPLPERKQ